MSYPDNTLTKEDIAAQERAKRTIGENMTALARTFPCFASGSLLGNARGIEPWDPNALMESSGTWSSGERQAAAFLLSVFNHHNPFNVQDALGVWDRFH